MPAMHLQMQSFSVGKVTCLTAVLLACQPYGQEASQAEAANWSVFLCPLTAKRYLDRANPTFSRMITGSCSSNERGSGCSHPWQSLSGWLIFLEEAVMKFLSSGPSDSCDQTLGPRTAHQEKVKSKLLWHPTGGNGNVSRKKPRWSCENLQRRRHRWQS